MLARLLAAILIVFCVELGLFLLVVPWTPHWQYNYFLFRWPLLAPWLNNHYLRGAVSGLGLIDLGLGLWLLLGFRELAVKLEALLEPSASEPPPAPAHDTKEK